MPKALQLAVFLLVFDGCYAAPNLNSTVAFEADASPPSEIELISEASKDKVIPLAPRPQTEAPVSVGWFDVTFYWVAEEDPTEKQRKVLYDRTCRPLAKVSRSFARKIAMEGTGRTRDGRTLNIAGHCRCKRQRRCYSETSLDKPWGLGVAKTPLAPFRSIAVDPDIMPFGTALYVPALDGVRMPGEPPWGNFVHDGCLLAADRGGNVRGHQIDIFAGTRSHFLSLRQESELAEVELHEGAAHCQRLKEPTEMAAMARGTSAAL